MLSDFKPKKIKNIRKFDMAHCSYTQNLGSENIYTKNLNSENIFHIVRCFKSDNYFIIRVKNILQS